MPDERPNILLIMSDEHDAAVTGCYGDPIVQTPHLDGLAERGITLDACYCNSPLCVPSRLSFTAGQYVSRMGVWNNSAWLPRDDYLSIARVLGAAGYDCFLNGKQHYDRTRRYGFRDLIPEFNRAHKNGKGGRRAPDDLTPEFKSWEQRSAKFYPAAHGGILDHDRAVTQTARGFLGGRGPDEKPFFLFAGYLAPHFPLIAPEAYADRYRGKVPMPNIPDGFLDTLPLNYRHLRAGFGLTETDPEMVQKGRDLYWALTDWFDDEVGKVLAALESSPHADNTIVIYTSDHGENKGDHGMWWKNCMYDHAARVPLIVSWPERWQGGQRRSQVCSLVDLVQTLVAISGVEAPSSWDGDPMLGVLDDASAPWKDTALSEYYGHNIASGFTMFRQGHYKYVYHSRMDEAHGPERELYDMAEDPGELTNLACDPQHAAMVEQLHQGMVKELGEEPDAIEQRCRADFARGYDRADAPA